MRFAARWVETFKPAWTLKRLVRWYERPWVVFLLAAVLAALVLGAQAKFRAPFGAPTPESLLDAPDVPGAFVVTGTMTLKDESGAHVALLLYAKQSAVPEVLKHLGTLVPDPPAQTGFLPPTGSGCAECGDNRTGAQVLLATMTDGVADILEKANVSPGSVSQAEIRTPSGGLLLISMGRLGGGEADASLVGQARGAAVNVTQNVRNMTVGACENLTRDPAHCSTLYGNFSLAAEWHGGWDLWGTLERARNTSVLGPIEWTANKTLVLPEATPASAAKPLARAEHVYLPTGALVWGLVAFGLGFGVDPMAKRLKWAPFLPVPFLGAGMLALTLVGVDRGWVEGPTSLVLLPNLLLYALILLAYAKTRRLGYLDAFGTAWAGLGLVAMVAFLWRQLPDATLLSPLGLLDNAYSSALRGHTRYVFLQGVWLLVTILLLGVLAACALELAGWLNMKGHLRRRAADTGRSEDEILRATAALLAHRHPTDAERRLLDDLTGPGKAYLFRRHLRERRAAQAKARAPASKPTEGFSAPAPDVAAAEITDDLIARYRELASQAARS